MVALPRALLGTLLTAIDAQIRGGAPVALRLTAVLGTATVLLFQPGVPSMEAALVPFTAGAFLYIAAADLIPELQHQHVNLRTSLTQVGLVAAGVGVMALFLLLD